MKYDWCSAGRLYRDEEMQAVYQKMGDARRATGRAIVFSLCQYGRNNVWSWGAAAAPFRLTTYSAPIPSHGVVLLRMTPTSRS